LGGFFVSRTDEYHALLDRGVRPQAIAPETPLFRAAIPGRRRSVASGMQAVGFWGERMEFLAAGN